MTQILVLVLASVLAVCCCSRPRYIGCQTSQECGKEACCVIGMGRYSIPVCQPRRELGEDCRPSGEPVNTTLHYPDGVTVDLAGVYYIHCPCQVGLACAHSEESPQCIESVPSNHLYFYSEEDNAEY